MKSSSDVKNHENRLLQIRIKLLEKVVFEPFWSNSWGFVGQSSIEQNLREKRTLD